MLNTADIIVFVATTNPERARFLRRRFGFSLVAFGGNGVTLRIARVQTHEPAPHTVLGWSVADIREMIEALTGQHGVLISMLRKQEKNRAWHSESERS